MPGDAVIIVRLVVASILGGLVGVEREVHGREAGIRTYLLVSLGSAMIMVLSEYLFFEYRHVGPGDLMRVDPSRIAAQAVTGIGFLGAGVIIRYGKSIRGLTTAACMWVTCAMGLTIGAGYYLYGAVVSAITLFALAGLKPLQKRLPTDWYRDMRVASEEREGQFEKVQGLIEKYPVRVINFSLRRDRQSAEMIMDLRLRFHTAGPLDRSILDEVYNLSGVKWVEMK